MRIFNSFGITVAFALLLTPVAPAWGPRAHSVINQVAVESLPQGDLDFLKPQKGYIVARASIPDSWRGVSEPFLAMLEALDAARADVEPIYQLDLEGAWEDAAHPQAREMVYRCSANGARLLRDLVYTAWTASGEPAVRGLRGAQNPISPENPAYNPETGSAPAPRSRQ